MGIKIRHEPISEPHRSPSNPHRARKKMNYFERGRSAFASLSERAAVWAYLRRLISMVRLYIGVYCHITLAAEELFFAPAVIISN